jgi:hypothetical protein
MCVHRHTYRTTSFRKGFRHHSSFTDDDDEKEEEGGAERGESADGVPLSDLLREAEAEGRNEAATAAEEVKREKEEIKKKGSESFKKTGLGDSWKESVEDIFRMFSKSPESKVKRKRSSSSSSASSSDGADDLANSVPPTITRPSSSPIPSKKPRTEQSE